MIIKVVIPSDEKPIDELLSTYCETIAKKNNATLYLLEEFLGMKLSSNETLSKIRNIILDTSGEMSRLPSFIVIEGDSDEEL